MNERIKEFADKAIEDMPGAWNIPDEFCEKFAELIVKECMEVAFRHTPDTEECEYFWLIHDKIKQHFGVEE